MKLRDEVIELLKGGWYSNFQINMELKSSSADRIMRFVRETPPEGYYVDQRKKDMPKERMAFLEEFMKNDPSEMFIFVADVAEEVNLYYLDRAEMLDFITTLWNWDNYCNNWRVTTSTTKIFNYFESRLGA
jgi:hypothetical protein